MDTAGHLCLVGNGENRWYDKIVQYIVFKNGRGGLNGEHTCVIRLATRIILTHGSLTSLSLTLSLSLGCRYTGPSMRRLLAQ